MKLIITLKRDGFVPSFYVPIYYSDYEQRRHCAFILIAPFVIVYHIVENLWYCFWKDICQVITCMRSKGKLRDI